MESASDLPGFLYCPKCDGNVVAASSRCHRCGLARPARGWPTDEHVGAIIGEKYRIIERIGRGGMGSVYLAEQVYEGASLGQVAIKFLQPRGTAREQEFLRKKFISEAGFARLFNSPHIIKVYDFGQWRSETYMAMEFLEGESMDDRLLRNETLRTPEAMDLSRQIAEALVEIHRHDVVHRDIKPENILILSVDGKDFIKILDFGIAKRIDPMGGKSSTQIGTPVFMSPEQVQGKSIDARSDVYSLGMLLWICLVGEPPLVYDSFDDAEAIARIGTQVHDIGQVRAGLPTDLRRLVNSMVHPDPNRRPQSSQVVVQTLRRLQDQTRADADTPVPGSAPTEPSRAEMLHRQVYGTGPMKPVRDRPHPRPPGPVEYTASPTRSRGAGRFIRILFGIVLVLGLLAAADYVYVHFFMDDAGPPPEGRPRVGRGRGPYALPLSPPGGHIHGR